MNIETIKHGMIVIDKFGNEYEVLSVIRNDRIFEDSVKLKCTKFIKCCISSNNDVFDSAGSIGWVNNKSKLKLVYDDLVKHRSGGREYTHSNRHFVIDKDSNDILLQIYDLRSTSTSYKSKRLFKNLMYSVKNAFLGFLIKH